jgi:hypothetical protein
MTETQEKNHTDPIDLSRTPLGQLMQRAVEYTHQSGADGTNAPPEKNSCYFWVPLRIALCHPATPWFQKCRVPQLLLYLCIG